MKISMEQSLRFKDIVFNGDDNPLYKPSYVDNIDNLFDLSENLNLFDYAYGRRRYVSFSNLLETNDEQIWRNTLEKIRRCESITIIIDFFYENEELDFIVNFYVGVFYLAVKNVNPKCYIYSPTGQDLKQSKLGE